MIFGVKNGIQLDAYGPATTPGMITYDPNAGRFSVHDAYGPSSVAADTLQIVYNNGEPHLPDIQLETNDTLDFALGSGLGSTFNVYSSDGYATLTVGNDYVKMFHGGSSNETVMVTDGYVIIDGYLSVTGQTIQIDTAITDSDHLLVQPGLSSQVAVEIMPSISNSLYTADLLQIYDGYNGNLVFNINHSGNVGIGTAAGSSALSVNGTIANVTSGQNLFLDSNGNGRRIYAQGANLTITNDGGYIFLQNSNGFIGVGSTSPSQMLDVAGDIRLGTNGSNATLHFPPVIDTSTPFVTSTYGNNTFDIGLNNSAKLSFNSDGDVALTGATTITGNNSHTPLLVNQASASWTSDLFTVQSATITKMTIDYTGKVGIGTNSPQTLLHVGDVGATIRIGSFSGSAGSLGALQWYNTSGGNWEVGRIQVDGDIGGANYGDMRFMTGAGSATATTKMSILYNGNVGIGTPTPASLLSVGSTNQFQVDSNGNIVKINNVTTSFPSSQGAASTFLQNDGAGNLSWAAAGGGGGGSSTSVSTAFVSSGDSSALATVTIYYRVNNGQVSVLVPSISGTLTTGHIQTAAGVIPVGYRPTLGFIGLPAFVRDNGAISTTNMGMFQFRNDGSIHIFPSPIGGSFTPGTQVGTNTNYTAYSYTID